MKYQEAYDYINSFTNYEKVPGIERDLNRDGLERVHLLMRLLGRPHERLRCVVVAGTKGKGSVVAMLDSVLREAGYKTGLYTSPHLHTFRERIRVNGEMIPAREMARIVSKLRPIVRRIQGLKDPSLEPTTYELATAIAFLYFQQQEVDIALLEVGLGGRLDAVNVTQPLASVITAISLDHTEILGDTLEEIAREKAGIIKPQGYVVSAPQEPEAMRVIESVTRSNGAALSVIGDQVYVGTGHLSEVIVDEEEIPVYQVFTIAVEESEARPAQRMRVKLPLLGNHQQLNSAVALATILRLREAGMRVEQAAIMRGFANMQWPGRFEIISRQPLVVADGAHNTDSMSKLQQAMANVFHGQKVLVVLGLTTGHNIPGIVQEISTWADSIIGPAVERIIVTRSRHPRAADPTEVGALALRQGLTVELADSVQEAMRRAEELISEQEDDDAGDRKPVVLVTGSLYVVAEAREYYGLAPDLSEEE